MAEPTYIDLRAPWSGSTAISDALDKASSALQPADIGASVQAHDADLAAIAALSTTGLINRTGAGTAQTLAAPSGALVGTTDTQTLTNKTLGAASLSGTLDGGGQEISRNLARIVASVSGALTVAAHSGCTLITSGNITIPTTAGFHAVIIAGGAHTVAFNSTTSSAMASGDIMTVVVQSATVIHAVKIAAADKVTFA